MKFSTAIFISVCLLLPEVYSKAITKPKLFNIQHDCAMSVALLSPVNAIPFNVIHEWQIYVTDADDQPLSNLKFEVNGGMESHGHGLPTQPVVTTGNRDGEYFIKGLKFQMMGNWFIRLISSDDRDNCSVRFDFEVTS